MGPANPPPPACPSDPKDPSSVDVLSNTTLTPGPPGPSVIIALSTGRNSSLPPGNPACPGAFGMRCLPVKAPPNPLPPCPRCPKPASCPSGSIAMMRAVVLPSTRSLNAVTCIPSVSSDGSRTDVTLIIVSFARLAVTRPVSVSMVMALPSMLLMVPNACVTGIPPKPPNSPPNWASSCSAICMNSSGLISPF